MRRKLRRSARGYARWRAGPARFLERFRQQLPCDRSAACVRLGLGEGARIIRQQGSGARFCVCFRERFARGIEKTLGIAFENIELAARERIAREELETAEREREQLNEIGIALSSQRDVRELLNLILAKAREITRADAGSLYLIEEDAEGRRQLRFMLTQNDSLVFPFKEFTLPLAEDSMAGYTALRGKVVNFADAYHIPPEMPFHFNDHYDRESGYRTKSLLTLPMRNAKDEVLGVLQLINAKNDPAARLRSASGCRGSRAAVSRTFGAPGVITRFPSGGSLRESQALQRYSDALRRLCESRRHRD